MEGDVPQDMVCKQVPTAIRKSGVFFVQFDPKNYKDLSADDNGIYDRPSGPTEIITIEKDHHGAVKKFRPVLDNQDIDLDSLYIVNRKYYCHSSSKEFKRTIITVEHDGSKLPLAIIQYKVGNSSICLKPHGNMKHEKSPFFKVKSSVLEEIRNMAVANQPKKIVQAMENSNGGPLGGSSVAAVPRNLRQVYNQFSKVPERLKMKRTGPQRTPCYNKLLQMMQDGEFVQEVQLGQKMNKAGNALVNINTFAATDTTMKWRRQFCTGNRPRSQAQIDMTFESGPHYIIGICFENPLFRYAGRPTTKHPTTLAVISTTATKDKEDYQFVAQNLKKRGLKSLTYMTDNECALVKAFEAEYPIEGSNEPNTHLHCFLHMNRDMKLVLEGVVSNEESSRIRREILGTETQGKRIKGLVDCEDHEFEEMYRELELTWPEKFQKWLLTTKGRARSVKDTLRLCMLKSARVQGGLGDPPNQCVTQRIESVHNVVKDSIGRQGVDQVRVHELIFENVFKQQEMEYIRAIRGQGSYRLCAPHDKLAVDPVQWYGMTPDQREKLIKRVFGRSIKEEGEAEGIAQKEVSVSIEDCKIQTVLPRILHIIWKNAAVILSSNPIIDAGKDTYVIVQLGTSCNVRVTDRKQSCDCKRFKDTAGICEHMVAVMDHLGQLPEFLSNFASKFNATNKALLMKQDKNGGKKKASKKPRHANIPAMEMEPILQMQERIDPEVEFPKPVCFEEGKYWQNNEPFEVMFVEDCKNAKSCIKCHMEFPKPTNVFVDGKMKLLKNVTYNLLVCHKERYQYPVKDAAGVVTKWEVSRSKKRLAYYCLKKSCILDRHPYFWKGKVQISDEVKARLNTNHHKFIMEQFSINLR